MLLECERSVVGLLGASCISSFGAAEPAPAAWPAGRAAVGRWIEDVISPSWCTMAWTTQTWPDWLLAAAAAAAAALADAGASFFLASSETRRSDVLRRPTSDATSRFLPPNNRRRNESENEKPKVPQDSILMAHNIQ